MSNSYFEKLGIPKFSCRTWQLYEPPYTDPYVQWCRRKISHEASPYPVIEIDKNKDLYDMEDLTDSNSYEEFKKTK